MKPRANEENSVCTLIAAYMCDSSHANGTTCESGRRKAIGPTGRNAHGSQFPNEELTFYTTVRMTAWLCFKKNVTVQIHEGFEPFFAFFAMAIKIKPYIFVMNGED